MIDEGNIRVAHVPIRLMLVDSSNPVYHQRSKHITIRHRFIYEMFNDGVSQAYEIDPMDNESLDSGIDIRSSPQYESQFRAACGWESNSTSNELQSLI